MSYAINAFMPSATVTVACPVGGLIQEIESARALGWK
jgi:hypothetical protein